MHKLVIQCPRCGAKTRLYFIDPVYEGPYRCWKCKGLFRIRTEDNELKSCEPLSEEEFEKYNK